MVPSVVRITGVVDGERVTLVEFRDFEACERACRNLDVEKRRGKLKAERSALQEERRRARETFHVEKKQFARMEGAPEPEEPPAPPSDLTEDELVELTAATGNELQRLCPHADSPKRDPKTKAVVWTDPDKRAKETAKLIATTALAYEQNGWAREVRIEVHP